MATTPFGPLFKASGERSSIRALVDSLSVEGVREWTFQPFGRLARMLTAFRHCSQFDRESHARRYLNQSALPIRRGAGDGVMRPRRDCHAPHVTAADLWPLLLHSVRYAMGRRTSAPSTAAGHVMAYGRYLLPSQRAQIADEIEAELARHERVTVTTAVPGGWLGAACDVRTWRELAAWLRARP